jgi:hypothetical protein
MNLRQFLENRERELMEEIADLHGQLAPKEAELAEIRRAKAAIGMAAPTPGGATGVSFSESSHQQGDAGCTFTSSGVVDLPAHLAASSGATEPVYVPERRSPYDGMTMKQLVVKVLREHFHNGATTRQMLEFFRDAWGRDIERTNLSPQLSRLSQEGIIDRLDDGQWHLVGQRKPYRLREKAVHDNVLRMPGEIVMLLDNEVGAHHEPIEIEDDCGTKEVMTHFEI